MREKKLKVHPSESKVVASISWQSVEMLVEFLLTEVPQSIQNGTCRQISSHNKFEGFCKTGRRLKPLSSPSKTLQLPSLSLPARCTSRTSFCRGVPTLQQRVLCRQHIAFQAKGKKYVDNEQTLYIYTYFLISI